MDYDTNATLSFTIDTPIVSKVYNAEKYYMIKISVERELSLEYTNSSNIKSSTKKLDFYLKAIPDKEFKFFEIKYHNDDLAKFKESKILVGQNDAKLEEFDLGKKELKKIHKEEDEKNREKYAIDDRKKENTKKNFKKIFLIAGINSAKNRFTTEGGTYSKSCSNIPISATLNDDNEIYGIKVRTDEIRDANGDKAKIEQAVLNYFKTTGRFENKILQNYEGYYLFDFGINTTYQQKQTKATANTKSITYWECCTDIDFYFVDCKDNKIKAHTNRKLWTDSVPLWPVTFYYYTDKTKALEQGAIKQIKKSLQQFIFASFPIVAEIATITDTNKKGEIKKVQLSSGANAGIHKDFKFTLLDKDYSTNTSVETEYDLDVDEVTLTNTLCKVQRNQYRIKELRNMGKTCSVITNFQYE